MIGNIKTIKTVTFICCKCHIPLYIEADTILQAEAIAKEMGWNEDTNGKPICADCA